jgi:hypothetical protein
MDVKREWISDVHKEHPVKSESKRAVKHHVIAGLALILAQLPLLNAAPNPRPLNQDDFAKLDSPVTHNINFRGRPAAALVEVLTDTGIVGGVVEHHTCGIEPQVQLAVKEGTTVRQALDTLVAKNPDYEWRFLNNVVDLTPKTGLPPIFDVRLRAYQLHTTYNWMQSANFQDLFNAPEIRKRIAELKIQGGQMTSHDGTGPVDTHPTPISSRPIDINIHDVSIEDALNVIANIYGNTVWVYTETTECNGRTTYTIDGWNTRTDWHLR